MNSGISYKQALQFGYVRPVRNKAYLVYLTDLKCPCGADASEAHHIIDAGLGGGMGTKATDAFAFPVCRKCHEEIHKDVKAWEERFGSQWMHVALSLHQAITDGIIDL